MSTRDINRNKKIEISSKHVNAKSRASIVHPIGILSRAIGCFMLTLSLCYDILYLCDEDGLSPTTCLFSYKGYGGKFKHLTFICQMLQPVYFTLSLLNDLFGSCVGPDKDESTRCRLQKLRDTFFTSIAWPVGMFVVITFWGIYAVDRELVYPVALDKYIPSWMNHAMHTWPMVFLLFEMMTSYHFYDKNSKGLSLLSGFALTYLTWISFIYYKTGEWVYPVLAVLNWPFRITFMAFLLLFFYILYFCGHKINEKCWGNVRKSSKVQ